VQAAIYVSVYILSGGRFTATVMAHLSSGIVLEEIFSDHAVLQASPHPFALFGYSSRIPGEFRVSYTDSGSPIPITATQVILSKDKMSFSWRLVRDHFQPIQCLSPLNS
jgi:hypothetical protein